MPPYTAKSGDEEKFQGPFVEAGLWVSEDLVSLDPCACPPACAPNGIRWLLHLPTWDEYKKDHALGNPVTLASRDVLGFASAWMGHFLLLGFFAMLPAASMLVLYAIPTARGRLWAILGESGFLVCALSVWGPHAKEKPNILTYMLG